jgi:hemerythrin-like metal-binding protein
MAVYKWSESYNLGNQEIDGEHKRLIELLGWLEEKLYREEDLDSKQIQSVVSELNEHVIVHFQHEESITSDLPKMPESEKDEHHADHRIWMPKITEPIPALLVAKTDLERRAHLAQVLLIEKAFWTEHFMEFDTKLANYLKPEQ